MFLIFDRSVYAWEETKSLESVYLLNFTGKGKKKSDKSYSNQKQAQWYFIFYPRGIEHCDENFESCLFLLASSFPFTIKLKKRINFSSLAWKRL